MRSYATAMDTIMVLHKYNEEHGGRYDFEIGQSDFP